MKRYKVTCLECGDSDTLQIDDLNYRVGDTEKGFKTNFLAFRRRPDNVWGFECRCGNDNRLAPQESGDFDKLVQGDTMSVKWIAASLLIPDTKQFKMEDA